MKKMIATLAIAATLMSNGAFAQAGSGAQAGSASYNNFNWAVGLGALAVVGAVAGIAAGVAASNPSSFSH